jgi:transposase InsO family protein
MTDPHSPSTLSAETSPAVLLPQLYYNASLPSSYGGVDSLVKASGLPRKQVIQWLKSQWAYTLHKPARRKKYLHRRYMVRKMDMQWQADLVEMQPYSRLNKGNRYMLTVIDIFSRYAWALPLKDKTAKSLLAAFKLLLTRKTNGRKPKLLQTDQGLEFENKLVRNYLTNIHGIELFSIKSPHKAAIVERFNRTLKGRMWRAFTKQGSYRWMELLPRILTGYNNSYHRILGRAPSQVTVENEADVWLHMYGGVKKVKGKPKFKIGDRVRVSRYKATFDKGYTPNWSEEEFLVHAVNIKFPPVVYTIRSLAGEIIEGSFYEQEMQAVDSRDEMYRIDKVLRTRGKGEHKQALVRWRGYEREKPTWIPFAQLTRVEDVPY